MRTSRLIFSRHFRRAWAFVPPETPSPTPLLHFYAPSLGHHKDTVRYQEGYRAQRHRYLPAHFFLLLLFLGDLPRSSQPLLHLLTLPTPHPITAHRATAILVALSPIATSSCLSRPNAALPLGLLQAHRRLRHVIAFSIYCSFPHLSARPRSHPGHYVPATTTATLS